MQRSNLWTRIGIEGSSVAQEESVSQLEDWLQKWEGDDEHLVAKICH